MKFEVVNSRYILINIAGAVVILDSFNSWLSCWEKLIFHMSDVDSGYGKFSHLSRRWFRVFYYRWILSNKKVGNLGYPPYKTIFEPIKSMNVMALKQSRVFKCA